MPPRKAILVVDDDPSHRRMLSVALESAGFPCVLAQDGNQALDAAHSSDVGLVFLDVRMPGMGGMEALGRLVDEHPELPVVMVTAHGDVRTAVEAMKLGARDFVEKPVDIDELRTVATDILHRPHDGASSVGDLDEPKSIVGLSKALTQVRAIVRRAAQAKSTVFVRGESGTGKELVAQAIHDLSPWSHGPFVAVNCAAVAEGVLESELFGHEKGAFTSAERRHIGRFEAAHGGTLFLDEIAEMRPHLQAKLLRVLQERTFERIGGRRPISVDIRIVAATNVPIAEEIKAGRFREDLYYRLAVVEIELPPLRQRREDILPTAQHILKRLDPKGRSRFSAEVASALTAHSWPGNVRELANVIERALLFSGSGDILAEHLPPPLSDLCAPHTQDLQVTLETGVQPGFPLEEVERDLISKTLKAHGQNRTRAAEALGLSRRALLYKLKRYGIS